MPSPINISGQNIKKTRLAKKLDAVGLCIKCANYGLNIDINELEAIETGSKEINDIMLESIAKALDVTVTSLLFGENDFKKLPN